jgi:hypothetical protein
VVNAVAEGKKAALAIHAILSGKAGTSPVQASRIGHRDGARGSGFLKPVRVPELEAAYFTGKKNGTHHG